MGGPGRRLPIADSGRLDAVGRGRGLRRLQRPVILRTVWTSQVYDGYRTSGETEGRGYIAAWSSSEAESRLALLLSLDDFRSSGDGARHRVYGE